MLGKINISFLDRINKVSFLNISFIYYLKIDSQSCLFTLPARRSYSVGGTLTFDFTLYFRLTFPKFHQIQISLYSVGSDCCQKPASLQNVTFAAAVWPDDDGEFWVKDDRFFIKVAKID